MMKKVSRNEARQARHERIRKNISGTNEVPRLNVFRSCLLYTSDAADDPHRV